MDVVIAVSVGLVAGFAMGIVFHKYAISEAQQIKLHVSAEVKEVRDDLRALMLKISGKV